MKKKYRLITRNGLDGLMCGVLLNKMNLIEDILFVHPKEMDLNKIKVTKNDIIANLPPKKDAFLSFDNHATEITSIEPNIILRKDKLSVARIIYHYFKDEDFSKFEEDLDYVDKIISYKFIEEDILNLEKWHLFNTLIDPRTGLERLINKNISHSKFQLSIDFIDNLENEGIESFLEHQDLKERKKVLDFSKELYEDQTEKNIVFLENNIALLDKRKEEQIYPGSRFYPFLLKSDEEIHYLIELIEGKGKIDNEERITITINLNPFIRIRKKNLGEVISKYHNGGGNKYAASCQIKKVDLKPFIEGLLKDLNY